MVKRDLLVRLDEDELVLLIDALEAYAYLAPEEEDAIATEEDREIVADSEAAIKLGNRLKEVMSE